MFVRKKPNPSGIISIQIIDKSSGKYKVVKTVGSSSKPEEVEFLVSQARQQIPQLKKQKLINFDNGRERELVELFFDGLDQLRLVGPELLLGKIFDEIGFNQIKDELFRSLVITRLCYPVSKLKTTQYLERFTGEKIDVERVYRYMDKLHSDQQELVQQISYDHTLRVLNERIKVVFYDVTTLYFESEQPDDFRIPGYSKDGKHNNPQIVLGLLLSVNGYPLAYEMFEGSKYEGHTLLPVVEGFKRKYELEKLVVVADAGMLSKSNVSDLEEKGYEYILGARLKNQEDWLSEQVLALNLAHGQCEEIEVDNKRLLITYSNKRAKRDESNRTRGLKRLEKAVQGGQLTKKNINNRGYNKYLKLEGELEVTIDYQQWDQDAAWDWLKGYWTNSNLDKNEVVAQYGNLWKIERAFRISKTDLRIRPIYHRLRERIEAHICIAFCAYKIYKELERQLKERELEWSAEYAIEIASSIFEVSMITPYSKEKLSRLHIKSEEQVELVESFNLG